MKILNLEDLSSFRCKCGCNAGVFIHSKCHLEAPTWVFIHPEGFLIVTCCHCKSEIMRIAIAAAGAEPAKSHWLEYKHATAPSPIVEGFDKEENQCVAMLLAGIPDKGGSATKKNFEMLVRQAFQGGLVAHELKAKQS